MPGVIVSGFSQICRLGPRIVVNHYRLIQAILIFSVCFTNSGTTVYSGDWNGRLVVEVRRPSAELTVMLVNKQTFDVAERIYDAKSSKIDFEELIPGDYVMTSFIYHSGMLAAPGPACFFDRRTVNVVPEGTLVQLAIPKKSLSIEISVSGDDPPFWEARKQSIGILLEKREAESGLVTGRWVGWTKKQDKGYALEISQIEQGNYSVSFLVEGDSGFTARPWKTVALSDADFKNGVRWRYSGQDVAVK